MTQAGPCHDCGLEQVEWTEGRNGVLRHKGGKPSCRFPCVHRCKHLDCAIERGDVAALVRLANRLGVVVYDGDGAALNPLPEEEDPMAKKTTNKKTKKTTTKKAASKKTKKGAKKAATKTKKATAAKKTKAKAKRATKKSDLPGNKYCPRCEKTRKSENFYTFNRTAADGGKYFALSTYCKPCYVANNKEWKANQE